MGQCVALRHQDQFEALEVKWRFMDLASTECKFLFRGSNEEKSDFDQFDDRSFFHRWLNDSINRLFGSI